MASATNTRGRRGMVLSRNLRRQQTCRPPQSFVNKCGRDTYSDNIKGGQGGLPAPVAGRDGHRQSGQAKGLQQLAGSPDLGGRPGVNNTRIVSPIPWASSTLMPPPPPQPKRLVHGSPPSRLARAAVIPDSWAQRSRCSLRGGEEQLSESTRVAAQLDKKKKKKKRGTQERIGPRGPTGGKDAT